LYAAATLAHSPSPWLRGPLLVAATSSLHDLAEHAKINNATDPVVARLNTVLQSHDANQLRHAVFENISPASPGTSSVFSASVAALGLLDHPAVRPAVDRGWATKAELDAIRKIATKMANDGRMVSPLQQAAFLALTQSRGLSRPLWLGEDK